MSHSTLSRSLQPLAASLWGALMAWTFLLAAVWVARVDYAWLEANVSNEQLRLAAGALVNSVVPAWLALAVANMHLSLTHEEGLASARRWLFITLVAALVLGVLARRQAIPFGPFDFKDSLGPRLFGVPVGWLLLWFLLVAGARDLLLWVRPRLSHTATAIAGALLALGTLANLHPLVTGNSEGLRFWIFGTLAEPAAAPWYVPIAALAFALGLSWMMREMHISHSSVRHARRCAKAFVLWNVLLGAIHLRVWLTA